MELTKNFIQQVTPPPPGPMGKGTQAFYRDSRLTGFALRVSSGGTKSYILERRIRGKVKRITLGRCDEMAFEKAQARARKLIAEVERENAPRITSGKYVNEDINLLMAYQDYLASHANLSNLTLTDYQRSMDGPLFEWQSTPVRDLTASMVIAKHTSYGQTHPGRCNNAMRLLRAVLNHVRLHMKTKEYHAILRKNPVDILSNRNLWHPTNTKSANTSIGSQQIKNWWQASLQLKKSSTREYLHFLLLSGLPPALIARLRFSDIDFDQMTINISSPNDNHETILFPITKYLRDQIYQRTSRVFNDSDYVFPGLTKDTPISDPRTAIQRIQKLSGILFGLKDLHRAFINLARQSSIDEAALKWVTKIYREKTLVLTDQEINALRQIQERVFLTVFFIIGSIK